MPTLWKISAHWQISEVIPRECESGEGRRETISDMVQTAQGVGDFLDYFLSECVECRIHFLWRPHLPDPKDDLVLELALAGGASFIVTHNMHDFPGVGALGIRAVTPDDFLTILSAP